MGGYGAGHLGFKYPELFGTVVINAGALIDPSPANIQQTGPMFGVFSKDNERRVAEHPQTLARKNVDQIRNKTNIRIGCGSLALWRDDLSLRAPTVLEIGQLMQHPEVQRCVCAWQKAFGGQVH